MLFNAFQGKKSSKSFQENTRSSNDEKNLIFRNEIFNDSQFQFNFDFELSKLCRGFGKYSPFIQEVEYNYASVAMN